MNYPEILKTTENIAREAGSILMTHYGKIHNIKYNIHYLSIGVYQVNASAGSIS